MNRRIQALVAASSMACVMTWAAAPASVYAVNPTVAAAELVNEQKQVRSETDKATAELNALILEFEHNGLGDGAEVQILKGIRTALSNLSQKDMEKVIALLEEARTADPKTATKALANAFSGQTGISVQLHDLLIQYQHEQDLADIALRLTRLADIENQNMRGGTALYRTSRSSASRSVDIEKAQLQVQQSQQQAIYAEAKVLLERLTALAAQADPTTAEHLKAVVAAAEKGKLSTLLSGAADDLHSANLFSAVSKERTARDLLRDLARLAAPTKDPTEALKDAAAQLGQAIRDLNFVAAQDKTIDSTSKDGDALAQLDDRMADVADTTEGVRKDIANLVPEAVPDLKTGYDQTQVSRKSLTDGKGPQAADQAIAAALKLTEARQKLLDQLAKIEEQKKAEDKIAKEKALLDQIIALRKQQEQVQADTAAVKDKTFAELTPRESALATNAQDLQKTAAVDSPIIAPVIGVAARDMDDAHTDLATKLDGPAAIKAQQAAIDELKKAEDLLNKDIAALEKKKEDLAKLEKARDQVVQLIKDQQKAEQEANKQAALDGQKPKEGDPTPQDVAKQEKKIADQAKDTAKDIADTAPDATKSLTDAAKNADDAAAALNKPDPKAADPSARQAEQNLDKAKSALDTQIAQLQNDLDQKADDAAKLADAAKKIDDAQKDIAAAQQPDPVAQLHDTQKKIADDLKNLPQDQPAVQDAANAAAAASDDLAKNDLPKAAADMQKATDAMAKAQDPAAKPSDAAKAALPALAQKQAAAQKQLAAIQAGDTPATPADALAQAGDAATAAKADDGSALPADAKAALAQAADALSNAAAAAAAGKPDSGNTDKAKAALDKAKAAVAMAQAGVGPGKGKAPGQGDTPGPNDPNAKTDENSAKMGKGDRINADGNASSQTGGHADTKGASGIVGLPPRDRDAIQQSRGDKYPEEYGPMIEQYLKNLSDQPGK